MTQIKADVVVIGSGISGLTAATILAKHGRKVIILEQNRKPGGALRRFTRQGVPFDVGFHYSGGLGEGDILHTLWKYLGILPNITSHPFPAEGNDLINFKKSGRAVRSFFSYPLLEEELKCHFPEDAQGIHEYLNSVQQICSQVPFYNFDLPLTPFLRESFYPDGHSLAARLLSFTDNQELLAVLAAPTLLYGVPPRLASMSMHASVAHGFYSGAYTVDGGGQAIVDAYLQAFTGYGGEVIADCQAREICIENGQANGVICNMGHIAAEHIIYTGHPGRLFDLADEEHFRPAYYNRLRDLKETGSMFIVFGATKDPQDLADLKWVNYYQIPAGLDILAVDQKNLADTALLITAPGARPTPSTDTGADRGVILMKPADWQEAAKFARGDKRQRQSGYREWKEKITAEIMEQANQLWQGSDKITPLALGTPLTCRDELGSPWGGVYGVQHNKDQFTPSARTKIPGLLLSGQNTLMAGIMGAALSGLVTVAEIEDMEPLWKKVIDCR